MGPVAIVFDTNVLISALGFGGPPLEALLRAFDDDLQLVASEEALGELKRVMGYSRLPFSDADREEFLTILRGETVIVNLSEDISEIDPDPDDDMFLECAVAAEAAVIVSGDQHLLELGQFRGIEIVKPADFLQQYA